MPRRVITYSHTMSLCGGSNEHPEDLALKHAAVLALARSGATAKARERYCDLGLGEVARSAVSAALYTDIATLNARIAKDLALAAGSDERKGLLAEAATRYRRIFEESGEYYPGVNAATLTFLSGEAEEAKKLAASVRAICVRRIAEGREDGYYIQASLAEASVVAGDEPAATEALAAAYRAADAKPDKVATTRKQLRVLSVTTGTPPAFIETLRPGAILHYAGHMIGPRLSETQVAALIPRIENILARHEVAAGFGSLASGGDIVIAEALLARGANLELVFPFRVEEFREISVRPGGKSWLERFDHCLARARWITFATEDSYLGDDQLFTYTSWLGIGLALQRARALDADARLLAIWDGRGAGGPLGDAGTADNKK